MTRDNQPVILMHPQGGELRSREQQRHFIGKAKGFTGWLVSQIHRKDPVGDFSRDVVLDTGWPHDLDAFEDALAILDKYGSPPTVVQAMRTAWSEFMDSERLPTHPDSVRRWRAERCTVGGSTATAELYRDYLAWCGHNRCNPKPMVSWGRDLAEEGHLTTATHRQGKIVRIK